MAKFITLHWKGTPFFVRSDSISIVAPQSFKSGSTSAEIIVNDSDDPYCCDESVDAVIALILVRAARL